VSYSLGAASQTFLALILTHGTCEDNYEGSIKTHSAKQFFGNSPTSIDCKKGENLGEVWRIFPGHLTAYEGICRMPHFPRTG